MNQKIFGKFTKKRKDFFSRKIRTFFTRQMLLKLLPVCCLYFAVILQTLTKRINWKTIVITESVTYLSDSTNQIFLFIAKFSMVASGPKKICQTTIRMISEIEGLLTTA
jgi:Na+/glutamate symporter